MSGKFENNKRIAKNTLVLYARMLFTMAVSFYTSRVVLHVLGMTDFGIYNVVGGLVMMFSFVSGAMASATQRFLSVEIGKGGEGDVRRTFSTAVLIHAMLAGIIIVAGEAVGVWFLNTYMNFPPDRYAAANWVYQLSLLTFAIDVASVPYNAAIIAYERMKAFAYVSIVDVTLKLAVVYLITLTTYDKLVVYAALLAAIAVSIRLIYGQYCRRNFPLCRCDLTWDRKRAGSMVSFLGWNLIGALAGVGKEQGINVVLNIFFGSAVNAARGVAYQAMNAISSFASNFQVAMNPQIIKSYAAGEKDDMFKLVFRGSKFSYLLLLTLSLPVALEAPFILDLWLKEVPEHTVIFLRIVLLTTLIDSLSTPLITAMHASGKVRDYQIVVGGLSLLTLPVAYLCFKAGCQPQAALWVGAAMSVACHFARQLLLRRTIGFPMARFLHEVSLRVLLVTVLSAAVPLAVYAVMDNGWSGFFAVCAASALSTTGFSYALGMEKAEKQFVRGKAASLLNKLKKRKTK